MSWREDQEGRPKKTVEISQKKSYKDLNEDSGSPGDGEERY